MNEREDLLLRTLAEQAREEIEGRDLERFDARWDDYSAGRLSEQEAAALIAGSKDPETQLAASLFKPLDEELKASVVARLQQEIRHQETSLDSAPPEEIRSQEAPESQHGPLARLRAWLINGSMFERRPRLSLAAGAMAALLLILTLPLLQQQQEVGALPPFTPSFQGIQEQRSAADGANDIFRTGHRFNFLLRPDRKVEGPLITTVVVQGPTGELQRWGEAEAAVESSTDGTVFTKGLTWPWGGGEWTLHFFLTRAPLHDDALKSILVKEGLEASAPSEAGGTGLGDGRWVQERIYVQP